MRIKINRYSIFYTLYIYFLVIFTILPPKYNGLMYSSTPAFIALSILFLFYILPVFLAIILVIDVINKRFKTAFNNVIIAVLLYLAFYGIRVYFLDVYIY